MIVRVLATGKDAAGLTRYLFGPGKANEHTNQRILAGSPELHGEWGDTQLTPRQASYVGRQLEASWRRHFVPELVLAGQGAGGISRANLAGGEDAIAGKEHVHHVTLSLRPGEGPYTDEQWRRVAETYMRGMGYTGSSEHADASWFAVHHGVSTNGNDHIHIAMCTTLRDGSTVDVWRSGVESQRVRRELLERLDFVEPLHDQGREANAPKVSAYTAAEHNIARQRAAQGAGAPEPDRVLLQRIVRAAAAQSTTEAGFINAVLSHPGVRIEPTRWEAGVRDANSRVTGYGVGIGEGPLFPASKLATDLTLGKLRPSWSETDESAQLARDLWAGDASKLDRLTATRDVDAQLAEASAQLGRFGDQLERLDPHDTGAWSQAIASLSGTAAVLATGRPDAFREHAGRVADVLARQALVDAERSDVTEPARPAPHVPSALNGAELATRHVQLALRAGSTDRHSGWLAVLAQINRSVIAIQKAKEARSEVVAATTLLRDAVAATARLETYVRETAAPPMGGAGVPAGEELSDAARRAQEVAGHARPGPGETPKAGGDAASGAASPERPADSPQRRLDDEQRRGRGR